jgi:hypothetical protein
MAIVRWQPGESPEFDRMRQEVDRLFNLFARGTEPFLSRVYPALNLTECQRRKIHLFILPPKSPKLNRAVERAHRTHTEEFYEVSECSWKVTELNEELRDWQHVYNCIRPHQALGYKTPLQFLRDKGIVRPDCPTLMSHM